MPLMAEPDFLAVPAMPRTSTPRLRMGREDGVDREHNTVVALKGFIMQIAIRGYQK